MLLGGWSPNNRIERAGSYRRGRVCGPGFWDAGRGKPVEGSTVLPLPPPGSPPPAPGNLPGKPGPTPAPGNLPGPPAAGTGIPGTPTGMPPPAAPIGSPVAGFNAWPPPAGAVICVSSLSIADFSSLMSSFKSAIIADCSSTFSFSPESPHPTNATAININKVVFMPVTLRLTGSGVNAVGGRVFCRKKL